MKALIGVYLILVSAIGVYVGMRIESSLVGFLTIAILVYFGLRGAVGSTYRK